jgi:hypothetical protein
MQTLLTVPHWVCAELIAAFFAANWCTASLKTGTCAKNGVFLNSFKELWVSFVRRVVWAISNADPWIGEIFHGLSARFSPLSSMIHSVSVCRLILLIRMHHLIVSHMLKTICSCVVHWARLRIFLGWKWASCKLCHWVIVGHCYLSIILIVLAKNNG